MTTGPLTARGRRRRSTWPSRVFGLIGVAAAVSVGWYLVVTFVEVPPERAYHPTNAETAARWYRERPEDFAEVVRLARAKAIPGVVTEYYGGGLPEALRYLSVNGKVAAVGGCDGHVLFLPQAIGIPDDAIGYVHMECPQWHGDPARPLDLFGDAATPAVAIADGWWWADGSAR